MDAIYDSGDLGNRDIVKRRVTAVDGNTRIRVTIRIDVMQPSQGKATLDLWLAGGWTEQCFRYGEELVEPDPRGKGYEIPVARSTEAIIEDLDFERQRLQRGR